MYINNELGDASRSCLDTCPSDSAAPGKTPCPEIGRRAFREVGPSRRVSE